MHRTWGPVGLVVLLTACDQSANSAGSNPYHLVDGEIASSVGAVSCTVVQAAVPLADQVRESSGLARGVGDPSRIWTHNDRGNAADLFAVSPDGRLLQTVRVTNVAAVDWEDIEAGSCETGTCLFVADIGDNEAARRSVAIYEIPEPAGDVSEVAALAVIEATYPDAPRDAESLFRLPSGEMYIVSKGREGPITIFRVVRSDPAGTSAILEPLRHILPQPATNSDLVTAATASPDGRWVGVRSYRTLFLYPADALVENLAVQPRTVDLTPLREAQGEGLAIDNDGTVWLSSEAGSRAGTPTLSQLRCELGDPSRQPP